MSILTKLRKHFVDRDRELLKILKQYDFDDDPAPAPFKPEPIPKNETYEQAYQRRLRDDIRQGKAVSMNAIARSVPRAKPPRAPGQQIMRDNGMWWRWE